MKNRNIGPKDGKQKTSDTLDPWRKTEKRQIVEELAPQCQGQGPSSSHIFHTCSRKVITSLIKGQSRGSKKYEKERKHGVICKLFSNDNMPYTSLLISLGGIDPSAINGLSSSKQSLNEGTIASQRFRLRRICLIRATVRPCWVSSKKF